MTGLTIEEESSFELNKDLYSEYIKNIIDPAVPKFMSSMRSYVRFHYLFVMLIAIQLVSLVCFITILIKSYLVALSLAMFFLTLFSYFILRFYFQTKKKEQFQTITKHFLTQCQRCIGYENSMPEHYVSLANASMLLVDRLKGAEYTVYRAPRLLASWNSWFEKMSCWWHWGDFHLIKEMLIEASIAEHVKLVRCEPTSLDAHAALANAYVALSGLYMPPNKHSDQDEQWYPSGCFNDEMGQKFRDTSEKAIEEFKILCEYAPNDPWVYTQLAYSYHDLQMPLEEIKAYERVLKLNPGDKETLYKLGILYFQQGMNAAGLEIYEELKRTHYKKAELLMGYYGVGSQ